MSLDEKLRYLSVCFILGDSVLEQHLDYGTYIRTLERFNGYFSQEV